MVVNYKNRMTTHLHMHIWYEQWIRFYTTLLLNGGGARDATGIFKIHGGWKKQAIIEHSINCIKICRWSAHWRMTMCSVIVMQNHFRNHMQLPFSLNLELSIGRWLWKIHPKLANKLPRMMSFAFSYTLKDHKLNVEMTFWTILYITVEICLNSSTQLKLKNAIS